MLWRVSTSSTPVCKATFARCFATETALPAVRHAGTHRLKIGMVVNRAPILTRTPTSFEKAYYAYQNRLSRALSNPFPRDFYFKPGEPLENQFAEEEKKREDWLFHRKPSKKAKDEDTVQVVSQDFAEEFEPEKRRAKADLYNNKRSLNRLGERNLYLLLKKPSKGTSPWAFPEAEIYKGERLHEAAKRSVSQHCGANVDTWVVGRHPIGFTETPESGTASEFIGTKLFFLKLHILAGQMHLNPDQYTEFQWLTKQEIEDTVSKEYWEAVRDMLSDF
ncbi:hypothetical protein SISNIDRAFT_480611 [Sistotremastrum niveocremeum HHB9708]|uniref:Large ribosomal subunit protein mL46 n=1 Tax=Sistotremastrum niveocremeum HHB9708 TaxID=1314777 RepID=A0A165AI00_9AGAM|nr:hypothetical protein SISNIDRAFT_480611 [Sistotremastrum niveocremeum HHB9708]